MEKPRILILGKLPPPLMGPALATEIILNSNLKDGFELHHFDTRINESVADMGRLKLSKIQVIRNKYSTYKKTLKEVKPQLILIPIGQTTAGFFKDMPFIKMGKASGAKVLIQLRGSAWRTWYNGLDAFRRMAVSKQLNKVSGAIVLGNNLRPIFQGLIPDENIFVVPNGADYTFPERTKKGIQITYLANYLPGKGILELLQALSKLAEIEDLSPFEFNAFGSWDNDEYRTKCRAIAKTLPNVTLNNAVNGQEKWQALADTDIFVFAPTLPEGHPWSVVEAMAAGLPIVSTDRGAIAQSVKDKINGFLLKDPVPEYLAEKIELLIRDAELRNTMGSKSREMYETGFTAAAMTENLGAVFNQILEQ